MSRRTILDDALGYLDMGLSVIPVANNKKPPKNFRWKQFQSRLATVQEARDIFDGRYDLGVALVMQAAGKDTYLRDFDSMAAYNEWARANRKLAETLPTSATKRGRHVYARFSGVVSRAFDDGEIRGIGNYGVAPNSPHIDGCRYQWLTPIRSLDSIPIIDPREANFIKPVVLSPEDATDYKTNSVQSVESVQSVNLSNLWHEALRLIAECLPLGYGTRRSRLFLLARRIRIHRDLSLVPVGQLRPLIQEWHRQALPAIRTKEFDETWADFVSAYECVVVEKCIDVASLAMNRVDTCQLPAEAEQYGNVLIRKLVALCFQLSLHSADGGFYLSCRKAAALLATDDFKAIARWMRVLVADRVLAETEKGGPHNNRATRYRWMKGAQ